MFVSVHDHKGDNMILGMSFRITEKFAIDITLFNKYRSFKDGIDFFHLSCESDFYEDDHNPKFRFWLALLNISIIEFDLYNINHSTEIDCEDEDDE
jgi:hypothetical protein